MKRRSFVMMLLAMLMLVVGAGIQASAGAIGDNYTIAGMNPGWILVIFGLLAIGLGYFGFGNTKKMVSIGIGVIVIGAIFLVPITAQTVDDTTSDGSDCCDFDVTGSAIVSGTDYIGDSNTANSNDATWDDDTLTLTVPLYVADSSDGHLAGHHTGVNLTFDPVGSGMTADDICTIHFESDYDMSLGGEDVLDEDSTNYKAIWTVPTTDGTTTKYIDHSLDVTANSDTWAQIDYTFVNNSAGCWISEIDQIGDTLTWYITAQNDCGTWSETITVNCIVTDYTA